MNLLHRVKQYQQEKNGHRKSAYFICCHGSVERQQTQSVYYNSPQKTVCDSSGF